MAAFALAFALAASPNLDVPDVHAEHDQARALDDALKVERAQRRFEQAAQLQCREEQGPQALAVYLADGSIRCTTRRGVFVLAGSRQP